MFPIKKVDISSIDQEAFICFYWATWYLNLWVSPKKFGAYPQGINCGRDKTKEIISNQIRAACCFNQLRDYFTFVFIALKVMHANACVYITIQTV